MEKRALPGEKAELIGAKQHSKMPSSLLSAVKKSYLGIYNHHDSDQSRGGIKKSIKMEILTI